MQYFTTYDFYLDWLLNYDGLAIVPATTYISAKEEFNQLIYYIEKNNITLNYRIELLKILHNNSTLYFMPVRKNFYGMDIEHVFNLVGPYFYGCDEYTTNLHKYWTQRYENKNR